MRSLLMGGQACVLYGAAEFSRDTDVVVCASDENLGCLAAAVADLRAAVIAVPPFEGRYLEAGHAVHFRCSAVGVEGMRLDVMTRIRGLPEFDTIWNRRTTLETDEGPLEVLSLPDLVIAKKTQRDKDWPMIARLVEANYAAHGPRGNAEQTAFWLRELRTPTLLVDVTRTAAPAFRAALTERPLLKHAIDGDVEALAAALHAEEEHERKTDREYWAPLRAELEALRRARRG